jgi:hypothetical protein
MGCRKGERSSGGARPQKAKEDSLSRAECSYFMGNESNSSAVFRKAYSLSVHERLMSQLPRWLPDQLHWILTDAELTQAEKEAISVLGSYWKGDIPSWLRH